MRRTLDSYQEPCDFVRRHIGPDDAEVASMCASLGVASVDTLIDRTVPRSIRATRPLDLPAPLSEFDALAKLRKMAAKNRPMRSLIGMGYYDCITPTVIQRNVIENPGWYTQYTPYQAEIAQGRLEALLNFQTMVADLTGLPIANASLLDEATAAAEAMTMCLTSKAASAPSLFFVDASCHPQTLAVIRTRAEPLGLEIAVGDPRTADFGALRPFGVLLQYPSSTGEVWDPRAVIGQAHAAGALVVLAADLLALAILESPGALGADIAIGNTQRFGVPLGYGGPHAAFFATKDEFKRRVPGRIIGLSKDTRGRPALRMALQTREQHIRRDKATSNICTSQVLLAIMAGMYAVYHGPQGIRGIASRVHQRTALLATGLTKLGHELAHAHFFDTLKVKLNGVTAHDLLHRATQSGFNLRLVDEKSVALALDEKTTLAEIAALLDVFAVKGASVAVEKLAPLVAEHIPSQLARKSAYLTHAVFSRHHSETKMLRYVRALEAKDLSLTRSMIPLGSCTMKLNATSELMPITWSEFNGLHPFAPLDQATGYVELAAELERLLAECTGFAKISLQPNSGAQGEYAGLLVIRKYHQSRGQGHRNVCLIPKSAHGTNPASAVMAGMKVVVVACDARGNVDLGDLEAKVVEHADALSALMITYPSTHGVFEEDVRQICDVVHRHGGQVYMDGANMNAQIGLCRPGEFGPDVCHLNLHKTFCIPHGGGGPGMGPIGVAQHLAPFLPSHPVVKITGGEQAIGPVSAAPLGSPSILPIPLMYIWMMGGEGLTTATRTAILNANYIAHRLDAHFPVLYRGKDGAVAHECIIDLRWLKAKVGLEVEDVAKRLMDYGFHAPTVSFPVAGTLMIEPTESESLDELDRFCEAMISIRQEIRDIEEGRMSRTDNPLLNAPHTADVVAASSWTHPYSREAAAFPAPWVAEGKFWPAVTRVDGAYGDRNLVCTCEPIESYS